MQGIKKINENVIAPSRSLTIVNNSLADNENWQVGTLKCDPTLSGLRYKSDMNGTFELFNATYILQPNTVTSELIKDGTIQTIDLADGCVTNDKIKDRTINHIKMQLRTLTEAEIADNAIVTRTIADKNITEPKYGDKSVSERAMADASISNRCLQTNSVATVNIRNGSITNEKIAPFAVTGDKIAVDTITWQNIAPYTIYGGQTVMIGSSLVQGRIAPDTITNWNIAPLTINTNCLMDGAVDTRTILDGAVTSSKIKPKTIVAANIADNTIGSAQIANGGIDTDNYKDYSVTKQKLEQSVYDTINNAVVYDQDGNVSMFKEDKTSCAVTIGTATNGVSNGNGSLRVFGDIQGDRVYNMTYADLAEGYEPGEEVEPGDIVEIREDGKIYKAEHGVPGVVVGIVSDEYAQCFGASKAEIIMGKKVPVGLVGRIHVKVKGPVKIGQSISVSHSQEGVGQVIYGVPKYSPSTIGLAMETIEEEGLHKVLCLIKLG